MILTWPSPLLLGTKRAGDALKAGQPSKKPCKNTTECGDDPGSHDKDAGSDAVTGRYVSNPSFLLCYMSF